VRDDVSFTTLPLNTDLLAARNVSSAMHDAADDLLKSVAKTLSGRPEPIVCLIQCLSK
jgi:hypothetical protein